MERTSSYRLLKLKEILFNETDEMVQLDMNQLQEYLKSEVGDAASDSRTIKRDIETLDAMDFEVIRNIGKFGKTLYSHQTRLFEVYQLRFMVDAVLSARFITDNEKQQLIDRMKQLTSNRIAKTLPEPFLFSPSANMDYEKVKFNIDYVHQAISERKVITCQYGKFNVDKTFVYHRNGATYRIEPYALIWQNDYYYLIGVFQETNEVRHYRLDRIRNISVTDETFRRGDLQLDEYVSQSFHMFSGDEIRIKVCFQNDLVNVVLDRFGHEADIRKMDDDHFVLQTKAKLSDGLINWLLTWGDKAKVLSPDYLVASVKDKIQKMAAIYTE